MVGIQIPTVMLVCRAELFLMFQLLRNFQIDLLYFNGNELRHQPTKATLSKLVLDFEACSKNFELIPDPAFSRIATQLELFIIKSYCVAAKINSGKDLPNTTARDFLQRNLEIDKKFHQICPEVTFKSAKAETVYALLFYVLVDLKEFKEAMLTMADCLVSTSPTEGISYNFFFKPKGNVNTVRI